MDVTLANKEYRIYPEFMLRLGGKFGHEGWPSFTSVWYEENGANTPEAKANRRNKKAFCEGQEREIGRITVTPVAIARTLEAECEKARRPFCSEIDYEALHLVQIVELSDKRRGPLNRYSQWFDKADQADVFLTGGFERGSLCFVSGREKGRCFVWRDLNSYSYAYAETAHLARGRDRDELRQAAWAALESIVVAFEKPAQ